MTPDRRKYFPADVPAGMMNPTWCDETRDWIEGPSETAEVVPQPAPTGNGEVVLVAVLGDLTARAEHGRKTYGTYLKTRNGRSALQDAYEEALDLCMYLKQRLMEEDGR